jgi:LEA14-like dessication related protein
MLRLLSVVVLVSGCSMFMKSIEKPKAEVRNVSMASAGFAGVTGELRLDVMNPNGFGVPLAGIDWQLSIGGTRAVSGSVSLSQTIPAKGIAPVTTSLTLDALDAAVVARQLAGGARDYRLHATIRFATQVGEVAVQVDHAGQLGSGRVLGVL